MLKSLEWRDMKLNLGLPDHFFTKGIGPKVNVMVWLEFEQAY